MICAFCNNPSAELLANKLGIEYGQKVERERIIKLLEADCKDGLGDHIQGCSHDVAIALIKGERSKKEQIADLMWLSEQQLIAENKREGENK